jgi:hypothetical protein
VHQVSHYPELHQDARSTKYKILQTLSVITYHEVPTKRRVERGVIITLTTIYDWSISSFNRILAITRAVIRKEAIILSSNVQTHYTGRREFTVTSY